MAHYTILTTEQILRIARQYDLKGLINYKILDGGSENTNYFLEADNGKFVITICEQKTLKETMELVSLLDHLEVNRFSSSKVIRNLENQSTGLWEGKPMMVKEFIDGKVLEGLSLPLLQLIGEELGHLHQITAPDYIPKTLNYGIERFFEIKKYAAESSYHIWLKKKQAYIETYISQELPKALIHSDLFYNNVIISEDEMKVTIMDFEEATYYYRIFDLGMAIIGLCQEAETINLQKAKSLIKGYCNEINLSPAELKSIKAFVIYAATAMSFWRYKNFNYINPTPALKDHYKALKNTADYVCALPANCFLE